MNTTAHRGEERVAQLIEVTNRAKANGKRVRPWTYELTAEVANIGVKATETSQTLQVNPEWLHFVVSSEDFKACVADEIVAWYLIQALITGY